MYRFNNNNNNYGRNTSVPGENYTLEISDYGPQPFVINMKNASIQNQAYRSTLWTGEYFQVTLMSILPGGDVGLEIHPDTDQLFIVEQGKGYAVTGPHQNNLTFRAPIFENYAVIIPANTWHNIVNTGNTPLKLMSLYAPPHHPAGTVHITKADSEAEYHE